MSMSYAKGKERMRTRSLEGMCGKIKTDRNKTEKKE